MKLGKIIGCISVQKQYGWILKVLDLADTPEMLDSVSLPDPIICLTLRLKVKSCLKSLLFCMLGFVDIDCICVFAPGSYRN